MYDGNKSSCFKGKESQKPKDKGYWKETINDEEDNYIKCFYTKNGKYSQTHKLTLNNNW